MRGVRGEGQARVVCVRRVKAAPFTNGSGGVLYGGAVQARGSWYAARTPSLFTGNVGTRLNVEG